MIEVVANTLEENSAVEGTVAGTFTATDEETPRSGLTITFTPGTNAAGYYAIDGNNVVLTKAGADHVNAGVPISGSYSSSPSLIRCRRSARGQDIFQ